MQALEAAGVPATSQRPTGYRQRTAGLGSGSNRPKELCERWQNANTQFGLDSFMAVTVGLDGEPIGGDQVVRDTVEEGVLAEQVGIDSFNIGEHYRDDMMDSAAHVVLAAIAGRTERIRLGTSVTVLSTQDPVRLYNNFATLDAVSGGRAQLILGRGSAIESFPLFGYDLREYEEIFEEKLGLFVELLRGGTITWSGKYRPPLTDVVLTPPLPAGHLPTWVGSGGSPDSVIRAARYGLPLMLAVIGGRPERFRPLVDLYRRALAEYGHPSDLPVGLHTLGYVAATDDEAIETQWPYWLQTFDRASRERGWRSADTRAVRRRDSPWRDVRRLAPRPSRSGSRR